MNGARLTLLVMGVGTLLVALANFALVVTGHAQHPAFNLLSGVFASAAGSYALYVRQRIAR